MTNSLSQRFFRAIHRWPDPLFAVHGTGALAIPAWWDKEGTSLLRALMGGTDLHGNIARWHQQTYCVNGVWVIQTYISSSKTRVDPCA